MIMPPDVAVTGLTELAVQARTDAGQVNRAPRYQAAACSRSSGLTC